MSISPIKKQRIFFAAAWRPPDSLCSLFTNHAFLEVAVNALSHDPFASGSLRNSAITSPRHCPLVSNRCCSAAVVQLHQIRSDLATAPADPTRASKRSST